MKPIAGCSRPVCKNLKYVLTDIDDTLTNGGRIPGPAFQALENLNRAGIKVIPITGRPAGWCDLIARMWPVEGVVGENGAFYFAYDDESRKMVRRYVKDDNERRRDNEKLAEIQREILQKVPGCAVSVDQSYREADLAIDFCEDVDPLSRDKVLDIVRIFEGHGACAKISSIHVNGWFGTYDKLSMTEMFFEEIFGLELDEVRDKVVYAGDSPNDEPMFEYFPHSVGVANIRKFQNELIHKPAWITEGEGGYGFAEMARHILHSISLSR